jgi:hypothetical protein
MQGTTAVVPLNTFDDYAAMTASHYTDTLPRIAGVQTYVEQTGECKGFQLRYFDTSNEYIYLDNT